MKNKRKHAILFCIGDAQPAAAGIVKRLEQKGTGRELWKIAGILNSGWSAQVRDTL